MKKDSAGKLFGLSLAITLLLFAFVALLLQISVQGTDEPFFSLTRPDNLHMRVEIMGSGIELDYTPLETPERMRRAYAPLLTPRLTLTAEYAADYAAYWARVLRNTIKEYLFARESYGLDVVRVEATVSADKQAK